MYKVHWIIDGIVEIDKKNQNLAEEEIREKIESFVEKNSDFFNKMGAKAIQGKAYLPGADEN